jgi:hypothetical protein
MRMNISYRSTRYIKLTIVILIRITDYSMNKLFSISIYVLQFIIKYKKKQSFTGSFYGAKCLLFQVHYYQ